ncbi:MAG: radical SAM protein [Candidatus Omnitrophica bacterium]|nr:radical SAM protein [Candidatus Omnitrophota bacterium]
MNRQTEGSDLYEKIVERTVDKFIPFKADWELTYGCNLKCIHCYQSGPDSRQELSTQEAFSCLDQLAEMGCLYLTLTGGEVLTREDFFEIAGYAREKDFAIRIFTNATLLDEAGADKIKKLNPLSVEISLYSADQAVHESITGVLGSFARTVNAFRLLKERGVHTVVKTTFMKPNAGEFDGLQKFSREIDAPFTFTFTVIPTLDNSREVTRLRIPEAKLEEMFIPRDWMFEGVTEGGVRSFEPLCSAGFNSLYISPYGEVFPCVTLRQDCGNIRETELKDIWGSGFFRELRGISFKDLKGCADCQLAAYCDRCAGLAWLEDKDLYGPSRNDCTLARVRKMAMDKQERSNHGKKEEEALSKAQDSL